MTSESLETAQRAIRIISEKFNINTEQLEKNIVSRLSKSLQNASSSDQEMWSGMETQGETPTAEEMIAFIVDEVKARNPEKKKTSLIKDICSVSMLKGKHH